MKRKTTLFLSEDLTIEILLRLPVKSLVRFKCVCKCWCSFISDPVFAKFHFNLAAAPTHRLLLKSNNGHAKFNCIDIDTPIYDDSYSEEVGFDGPLPSCASRFGCEAIIVGSCRGFILLNSKDRYCLDFVVWNPSTGLHRRIDVASRWTHGNVCDGIGYDSSTDDYVIVAVALRPFRTSEGSNTEVHCFSLRTGSWSCIQHPVPYYCRGRGPGYCYGLLLNGALHWLVQTKDHIPVIIAFHLMERTLSEIHLPLHLFLGSQPVQRSLRIMGGYLCFHLVNLSMNEMWTMEQYKVESSWTKSFVLSSKFHPLSSFFLPLCFMKSGEILGANGNYRLVKRDEKGKFHPHGDPVSRSGILDSVIYRESLLSLPGDIQKPTHSSLPKKKSRPRCCPRLHYLDFDFPHDIY